MRNKVCWVVLLVLINMSSCSNRNKVYEEEELFFKYLGTFFKEDIKSQNYQLQVYRTKGLCVTCRQVPLDTVLARSIANNKDMPLYVLFDNEKDLHKAKERYGNAIQYLCGDESEMDRYGFPKLEPLLFTIKNKKIIKYEYYENLVGNIGTCVVE